MTIEMIPDLPENVVGFVARGEVTSEDYTEVLDPAVRSALDANDDGVRLLYVLGEDFTGFSGGAMWEDGKLGMQHISKWERLAVVTDRKWIADTVGVFGHLIPAKVKVFAVADEEQARSWVAA